ncbi:MAG: transposase [Desulfotomaculum sp.]|nr:transposase [Desulfotomaculum sp.]
MDVGLEKFATLSTGETFENPRKLRKAEKKLKKHQRQLSKKKKGSTRRKKAVWSKRGRFLLACLLACLINFLTVIN